MGVNLNQEREEKRPYQTAENDKDKERYWWKGGQWRRRGERESERQSKGGANAWSKNGNYNHKLSQNTLQTITFSINE